MSDNLKSIKLLIIGDSTAGKTCLLQRFIENKFNTSFIATIGIDFRSKMMLHNNIKRKVTIWDTAGQERFRNITRAYYRGSMGMLLVYDITNRASFENMNRWIREIKSNTSDNVEIIIIGNKNDLETERKVNFNEGQQFADSYNLNFYETSAKTGENVEKAFEKLVSTISAKIEITEKIQENDIVKPFMDQTKCANQSNGCANINTCN